MKQALVFMIFLALLESAMVNAQRDSSEHSSEFSLNQLQTSTNDVFEMIDADENGSITLDEIDLLREESNEPLSIEELTLRSRRLGLIRHYFWTEEEINRFEVGDTNSDRSMTREEFENLSANVRTHRLELGLKFLDTNKNGNVEAEEFAAHLDSFAEWDKDGDGSLNRKEIADIPDHNRVQIELYRPVFDMRLAAEIKYHVANRERRAAVAAGQDQTDNRRLPPIYASGTAANIKELREASTNTFNILDANNSGSITLEELDIADELIDGEEKLPPEKLAELRRRSNIISYTFLNVEERVDHFLVADTDHNGTLSELEFDLLARTVRTHILQLNLDSFDQDKSGSIVLREFSAHLDNIEEIDKDGDGNISPKEMRGVSDFRLNMDVHVYQSEAFGRARASESQSQGQ